MMAEEWTEEWPKEPGWYWAYGGYDSERRPMTEPKLNPMQAIKASNGISYVVGSGFVYPHDYKAVFTTMVVPSLPD
jgi:hypothetical protein